MKRYSIVVIDLLTRKATLYTQGQWNWMFILLWGTALIIGFVLGVVIC